MTRWSLLFAVVVGPTLFGTDAHAIPLGTLIEGGTIEVGDKLFSNFNVHDVAATPRRST